ncbi:MAG: hypothetical protein O2V44_02545 [Candidatus Bathyarchaeota archaeon]|nr:hypothetical protein [Candidatus Bathyarchaeota archaeon]
MVYVKLTAGSRSNVIGVIAEKLASKALRSLEGFLVHRCDYRQDLADFIIIHEDKEKEFSRIDLWFSDPVSHDIYERLVRNGELLLVEVKGSFGKFPRSKHPHTFTTSQKKYAHKDRYFTLRVKVLGVDEGEVHDGDLEAIKKTMK